MMIKPTINQNGLAIWRQRGSPTACLYIYIPSWPNIGQTFFFTYEKILRYLLKYIYYITYAKLYNTHTYLSCCFYRYYAVYIILLSIFSDARDGDKLIIILGLSSIHYIGIHIRICTRIDCRVYARFII